MKASPEIKSFAAIILNEMLPVLNEKQQRHLSNIIATNLGYDGVSFVNSVTGQSRNTISSPADFSIVSDEERNDESLSSPDEVNKTVRQSSKRLRRPGGGRKPIDNKYPDFQ